jgi:hypothetical protein
MNTLVTIQQAAEYCQVGTQTIYRWIRAGKLTPYGPNKYINTTQLLQHDRTRHAKTPIDKHSQT